MSTATVEGRVVAVDGKQQTARVRVMHADGKDEEIPASRRTVAAVWWADAVPNAPALPSVHSFVSVFLRAGSSAPGTT
jgi:predicted thioesterase